jgi:hypothetical protein
MSGQTAATLDPLSAATTREQRSEPRKPLRVAVTLQVPDGGALQASTVNLSAHGMDLVCSAALRPAMRCEVSFGLPVDGGLRLLTLQACVVRSQPSPDGHDLGLHFLGPPQRAQELIEYYVCC